MLRMGTAGIWTRSHASQTQDSHQPLDAFSIDEMPQTIQKHYHSATAEERVSRVFGVDCSQ